MKKSLKKKKKKINRANEPKDARDEYCRIEMLPSCKASIEQTLRLVKAVFGERELSSERYVHHKPEGLVLDILGRIDFESEDKFLELKSKPINFRKNKNGFCNSHSKTTTMDLDSCEPTIHETSCLLLGSQ